MTTANKIIIKQQGKAKSYFHSSDFNSYKLTNNIDRDFRAYNRTHLNVITSIKDIINIRKKRDNINTLNNSINKFIINQSNIAIETNYQLVKYIDYGGSCIIYLIKDTLNNDELILKITNNADLEFQNMFFLSNLVKEDKTPHFVRLYDYFKLIPIIYNEEVISQLPPLIKMDITKINNFSDGTKISALVMEKFDGNLINLLTLYMVNIIDNIDNNSYKSDEDKKLRNLYLNNLREFHIQIFITILTFHSYYGYHADCQYKNFFYKSIPYSKNEYFKYKIFNTEYYIKNNGFLIVLGDYGTNIKKSNLTKEEVINDYIYLNYYNNYNDSTFFNKLNEISYTNSKQYELELFNYIKKNNSDLILSSIGEKPIINDTPYKIYCEEETDVEMVHGGKKIKKIRKIKKY
jgi:hypothetical protein